MWLDKDTNEDYINFGETAELIESILREPAMLPVSIGVYGGWGAGKSTILRLVEAQITPAEGEPPSFTVVNFDAWLYQDFDDARAALMETIGLALADTVKEKEGAIGVAKKFLKRVDGFRLMVGAADLALSFATGGLTRGLLGGGAAALQRLRDGETSADDEAAVREGARKVADATSHIIHPESETPTQQINAFRKEFMELMKLSGRTLVVFIDNLDRCLPRNAIQTLEAIRLFLFMPGTAFVVAADEDMVRHSVREHFGTEGSDRHIADYLDKLIQVPIRVPRLGEHEVRTYMYHLFAEASGLSTDARADLRRFTEGHLRQSWRSEPFTKEQFFGVIPNHPEGLSSRLDLAERLAPLLAKASRVDGNPRTIKRMLNSLSMRTKLSRQRGMNLNEAVLAKLVVFERCTDQPSTAALFSSVTNSSDGQSPLLKLIEADSFDLDSRQGELPDVWKQHISFIKSWVLLEPKLTGTDLRPAIYLSRETAVLHVARAGLSPAATDVLRLLLKAPNTGLPVATREAKKLTPDEASTVMRLLVEELQKVTDWSKRPAAFNGAHTVANAHPHTSAALCEHVRSLSHQPAWTKALLKQFNTQSEE